MKKGIIVIMALICILGIATYLTVNRDKHDIGKEDLVKNYCEKYVTEYQILEAKNNGTIYVTVDAPDFYKISQSIFEETGNREVTISDVKKAVKEHPDYLRNYSFWADNEDEVTIKKAFLDKVAEDLMINEIQNFEYTEEWSGK